MKKIILTIFLIVSILISFYLFYSNKNSNFNVDIKEAKMFEGIIQNIDNNILVEFSTNEVDLVTKEEKNIKESFSFHITKDTIIKEVSQEIKSEEEFRRDENNYKNFQNKIFEGSSINVFEYLFPPTWNKMEKISFDKLALGDLVSIVYYENNGSLFAVKILKKRKKINSEVTKDRDVSSQFTSQVTKVGSDYLEVKKYNQEILAEDILIVYLDNNSVLLEKKLKIENEFREEEREFKDKMQEIKKTGGDKSSIIAPSWFEILDISLSDINPGDKINLDLYKKGDKFFIKELEKFN
jgi:hypothetical protein